MTEPLHVVKRAKGWYATRYNYTLCNLFVDNDKKNYFFAASYDKSELCKECYNVLMLAAMKEGVPHPNFSNICYFPEEYLGLLFVRKT